MKNKKIEIEKNAITAASNAAIFINKISHGIACGLNHKALSILYKDAKDHFQKLDEYLYELYELYEDAKTNGHIDVVRERFSEFLKNQKDLDPEITKIINDNFWDLL